MAVKSPRRTAASWRCKQVMFSVGVGVRLSPGALPCHARRRKSAWGEQPSIPDHGFRCAGDDAAEIAMPWVDENVPFSACHDRRHNQHRRSQLANPCVTKGSGHAQVCMVPTDGQAALIVSLDCDRRCDDDLDRDMSARHPSDASMGQTFQHRTRIGAAGIDNSEAW